MRKQSITQMKIKGSSTLSTNELARIKGGSNSQSADVEIIITDDLGRPIRHEIE